MGKIKLLGLLCLLGITGCMDMDSFLSNGEVLANYTLPGNIIPDELIEAVTFESEGKTLYGFWAASNGIRPGITILYFHGNKHHLDKYWDRVILLHKLGVNVFIFDYQGFGRSEGEFSEQAMLADAKAALDYTLSRPEVTADSLALYGYSLGNVASVYLAAEVIDPLTLIAEAPFASANSLTQGALNLSLPAGWLTKGNFDNAQRIKQIKTPFMLFHGEQDDFVRYRDNGKVIYQNAPEPKSLQLSEASHNNIPATMGIKNYLTIIRDWIDFSITQ